MSKLVTAQVQHRRETIKQDLAEKIANTVSRAQNKEIYQQETEVVSKLMQYDIDEGIAAQIGKKLRQKMIEKKKSTKSK